jgi:hypothetical protein
MVLRLAIALIAAAIAATPTHSAEIGCATVWSLHGLPKGATVQTVEEMHQRRFPSGRRPVLGTSCFTGVLRGTIVKGDDEKLVRFYRANHPFLASFLLISPGGNVDAAINIGRLFRKYLIEACALIWFGAVEREGEVGLHRPSTQDPAFKALSPAEASTMYRRILGSITGYLDEMEVPRPMVDAMVGTGSSEIRWVDSDTDGLRRPPSIAEWEDASCGSFTSEERNAYYRLAVKTTRSSQEQQL